MDNQNTTVKIGEIHFEKYPRDGEKMQYFVKKTLQKLLENNLIPQKEFEGLLDKKYSKEHFNLDYPMLSKYREAYKIDDFHFRYYGNIIYQDFYFCNSWYNLGGENENRARKQREGFAKWLETLAK